MYILRASWKISYYCLLHVCIHVCAKCCFPQKIKSLLTHFCLQLVYMWTMFSYIFKYFFFKYTVNLLRFQTLVACQNNIDKQLIPRSDSFFRSSLIRVFPVCYSDIPFVNSSFENQHLFSRTESEKCFEMLEH